MVKKNIDNIFFSNKFFFMLKIIWNLNIWPLLRGAGEVFISLIGIGPNKTFFSCNKTFFLSRQPRHKMALPLTLRLSSLLFALLLMGSCEASGKRFDCKVFCRQTGYTGMIGGCRCSFTLFTSKRTGWSVTVLKIYFKTLFLIDYFFIDRAHKICSSYDSFSNELENI